MEDNRAYVRSHADQAKIRYIPVITDLSLDLKTSASKNSAENLETFVDTISNEPISISFSGVMNSSDVKFFLDLRSSRDLIDFKFIKNINYDYEKCFVSSLTFKETKEKSTTIEFSMEITQVKTYEFLKVTMIQVDETVVPEPKETSRGTFGTTMDMGYGIAYNEKNGSIAAKPLSEIIVTKGGDEG